MFDTDQLFEIDLANLQDSEMLADVVVKSLDNLEDKNIDIKLKLENVSISQAQMVFIKSLIESYGHKLIFVDTEDSTVQDFCHEMGIYTPNMDYSKYEAVNSIVDIQNETLDDLREHFKPTVEEPVEVAVEENVQQENYEEKTKVVEIVKDDLEDEVDVQKQVIGVYRKADEKENKEAFIDEEVDFYVTPTEDPVVVDTKKTIYVNQTLRSGQILDFDGNVVIIGDCHPGSEIKATGDITVWGVLGSIAHAGIKGNQEAKIRALKMNAVQLRIANCYSRRPDGGNIPYIVKSSTFTPEEARIVDDNIVLFKMAQN